MATKDILDKNKIKNVKSMIQHIVENNIPGDIIDCGVYYGQSALLAMNALIHHNVLTRDVYLYDTFDGMPIPDAELDGAGILSIWKKWNNKGKKWACASLKDVQINIKGNTSYPNSLIHYIAGMVEDTLLVNVHDKIAYIRLDTDFYSSTKIELEILYPKLSIGGVIIIDDYNSKFKGSTKATNDYFTSINIPISDFIPISKVGVYYIKK